jgi:XXXCH domain-containing protein
MKSKIEKKFNRLELADYLEKIAGKLRSGTIEAEGHQWTIPETIETQVKHKEKKGRIETKLKWRWSTLDDYEPAAREEVARWQDNFKTLKKRMARQYKMLEKSVTGGGYPDDAVLEEFISDSNEMARFADPEWQEAMIEYQDHLENLRRAVANKQLEVVHHEIRDLRARMKACHRDFK